MSFTDDIQQQNEILKSEVEMLQIRLKQFGQVQELASMLQQSHKSVQFNLYFKMNDIQAKTY